MPVHETDDGAASNAAPSRRGWARSVMAVAAGFVVVVVASLATDAAMHGAGFLPAPGQPAGDGPLFVALCYRIAYSVAGSYLTARLAPRRPMAHAMFGGAVGFVLSLAGAIATWNAGPAYGPHWYPLALVVTALPCAWAGARIRLLEKG
jgi:hypothetical protein